MSARAPSSRPSRGVALTVALLLLLVLTLLAVASLHGASTELALAGNEQFRQQAAAAAEVGIEAALAALPSASLDGATSTLHIAVAAREANAIDGAVDHAIVQTRYVGDVTLLPGFSVGRFVGRDFEIRSTGSASRAAQALRVQGALRIEPAPAAQPPPSRVSP